LPYYVWGLAWWLGAVGSEIGEFVIERGRVDAVLMLAAVTGLGAAEAFRRHDWRALSATATLALLAAVALVFGQVEAHGQPFAELGWLAWAVYALCGLRGLAALRERAGPELGFAHAGWLWAWTLALGIGLQHWLRADGFGAPVAPALGGGWSAAALLLPVLASAALLLWRPRVAGWPLAAQLPRWRAPLLASFLLAAWIALARYAFDPAPAAPLPWLPLLNPLGLLQWAALAIAAFWLASPLAGDAWRRRRVPLLATAGFALITLEVLRSAHAWGGVPWAASMFETSLVQTSLTVVWSALGVAGWIAGSRRGQRGLWLAGAVLMAVVLAKLVLVDRSHLGNLLGIASFIAYGLLCTLVGYFAPAPPSASAPAPRSGSSTVPSSDSAETGA